MKIYPGQRFGNLVVICKTSYKSGYWRCVCDCGATKDVSGYALRVGSTKSCGCLRKERMSAPKYKPGNKFIFQTWQNMIRQGYDRTYQSHRLNGKRRVPVCVEWENYYTFAEWIVKQGPIDNYDYQLILIDERKDYSPDNCVWMPEPCVVRTPTYSKYTGFKGGIGAKINMSELCRACGMQRSTVYRRLKEGWPLIKAISIPPEEHRTSGERKSYALNNH